MNENELSKIVIDTCVYIHKEIGPGLLESAYETILEYELNNFGLNVKRQVPITTVWKKLNLGETFRADLIVNDKLLIELKATEVNHPVYSKQVLTYLKLTELKLGLLINFGMSYLKDGIVRIINGKLN